MKKEARILIIAALLISMVATFSPVQGQLAREDVYNHSSSWGPPQGWNPLTPEQSWAYGLMYPTLYFYSRYTNQWIPYAAESYEWVDKYTLQVKIKKEAKWWDGKPVTAEDYKYSLELGKKYVAAQYTPLWDYIDTITAVDEKTIQITTTDAKLNYFEMLTILFNPVIVPKHIWEGLVAKYGDKLSTDFKNDITEEIVGAGPYRLMSWTEEGWTYERVDDWWGKDIFGLPTPKYASHTTYKDNVAAALAFEGGDLDVMTHFTPKIWEMWEVKGLPVRTYYNHPPYYVSGGVTFLWINFEKKPLANAAVRRAIAHALPIDEMIEKAYYNYGTKAVAVPIIHTSPASVLINDALIEQYGWEYDLDKAKKILDDAGIKDTNGDGTREVDGTELAGFIIQVPFGWSDWMMMCDMMATNLGKIGIGVTAEFPDFSVWWARLGEKNWDFVIGWAAADPGFNHPWNAFRSTMDLRLSHPSGNWENYKNPDVPALVDAVPKESDAAKLKAIYDQLQEIWLTDIPGVPIFYGATWYEYSEAVWVGWPNEENGFWFSNFWEWPDNLPALFSLAPKGATPKEPSWVANTKFTTDKIFADLAKAPAHGYVTVTETVTRTTTMTAPATTVTQTQTQTTTKTETVTAMDVTSVAGAGIVALVIGVIVGWLVGKK